MIRPCQDWEMDPYMVVATFKPGTHMPDVFAMVPEEQAQAAALTDAGKIGQIFLATAQGKVFIYGFGESDEDMQATIESLPMSKFWDLEIYPIAQPGTAR